MINRSDANSQPIIQIRSPILILRPSVACNDNAPHYLSVLIGYGKRIMFLVSQITTPSSRCCTRSRCTFALITPGRVIQMEFRTNHSWIPNFMLCIMWLSSFVISCTVRFATSKSRWMCRYGCWEGRKGLFGFKHIVFLFVKGWPVGNYRVIRTRGNCLKQTAMSSVIIFDVLFLCVLLQF